MLSKLEKQTAAACWFVGRLCSNAVSGDSERASQMLQQRFGGNQMTVQWRDRRKAFI